MQTREVGAQSGRQKGWACSAAPTLHPRGNSAQHSRGPLPCTRDERHRTLVQAGAREGRGATLRERKSMHASQQHAEQLWGWARAIK